MKTIFRLLLVLLAAVFFLPTLATILLSFLSDGSIQLSGYDDLFFDCFILKNVLGFAQENIKTCCPCFHFQAQT